jgi:heptose-I-phosphate ethanolaminephosphotransferase
MIAKFNKLLIILALISLPIIAASAHLLIDFNTALLYISSAVVFFSPYYFFKNITFKRIFWLISALLVLAWSATETLHILQEKSIFNYLALKIFLESNIHEMKEYLAEIVPLWALVVAILLIGSLLFFLYRMSHKLVVFSNIEKVISLTVLLISIALLGTQLHSRSAKFGFLKNEYEAVQNLNNYYESINLNNKNIENQIEKLKLKSVKNNTRKTYVLIIGESTSKHHLSLYGYWRNTNPLLAKRNDIVVYNDVVGTNTSTIECLGKCLTVQSITDTLHNFSSVNILDIANAMGIKTYWLSNQTNDAFYKNSIVTAANRAQQVHFIADDVLQNKIADDAQFDELLLPLLQQALQDSASEKLIVLHLIGCHFKYDKRMPEAFKVFNGNDSVAAKMPFADSKSKQYAVNNYDNAVLYNDYVVNKIFNLLDSYKPSQNISSIYFSDHADEVYDYRNFIGHTPQGNIPYLHEVPFVTWNMPDSFNINYNKPIQMENFAKSLCTWMNIKSPFFLNEKNIFNCGYVPSLRVLGNGAIYQK